MLCWVAIGGLNTKALVLTPEPLLAGLLRSLERKRGAHIELKDSQEAVSAADTFLPLHCCTYMQISAPQKNGAPDQPQFILPSVSLSSFLSSAFFCRCSANEDFLALPPPHRREVEQRAQQCLSVGERSCTQVFLINE